MTKKFLKFQFWLKKSLKDTFFDILVAQLESLGSSKTFPDYPTISCHKDEKNVLENSIWLSFWLKKSFKKITS